MADPEHLRRALRVLAAVPVLTGLASVLFGSEIVRGHGDSNAAVESELRFYAVFWIGFGIYLSSLAPRIEARGRELRAAAAVLFAGGVARLIGMAVDGRPPADYVVLTVIELVLPPVLVAWQARVAAGQAPS